MKKVITSVLLLITVVFTVNAVDMKSLPIGIFKTDMIYKFVKGTTLDDFNKTNIEDERDMGDSYAGNKGTFRIKEDGFVVFMLANHLGTMQITSVQKEPGRTYGIKQVYICKTEENKKLKLVELDFPITSYHIYIEYEDGVIILDITPDK